MSTEWDKLMAEIPNLELGGLAEVWVHAVKTEGDKLQAKNNALHDLNASQFQEIGRCMKIERKLEAINDILKVPVKQGPVPTIRKIRTILEESANNGEGGTQ